MNQVSIDDLCEQLDEKYFSRDDEFIDQSREKKESRNWWQKSKKLLGYALVSGALLSQGVAIGRWVEQGEQSAQKKLYEDVLSDATKKMGFAAALVEQQAKKIDVLQKAIHGSMGAYYTSLIKENNDLKEQQQLLLQTKHYPIVPLAIDTLSMKMGTYVLEINKQEQETRLWQRARYRLVAQVPCSTGRNKGEKSRAGDERTPAGYFSITSITNSAQWTYHGRTFAYGKYFARLNFGSWKKDGSYDPQGHCSIGIHGTDQEEFLGREASEGCIRMPNKFWEEQVETGVIKRGTQGVIIPYTIKDMRSSMAGVGGERFRKFSEKSQETYKNEK